MPDSTAKITIANSDSMRVKPVAERRISFAPDREAHQRRDRALWRARPVDLHLDAPEERVGRGGDGLAPRERDAALLGVAGAGTDVGPEGPRGVLGDAVLRDPRRE